MNASLRYLEKAIKKSLYFLFGNTIARLFYPNRLFKSKYFSSIGGSGWKWVYHSFISQKILGVNRNVPWPTTGRLTVVKPENIDFDYDDLNNFQSFGIYFQANGGKLSIGKGTYIAPNVGLITSNHNIYNLNERGKESPLKIGENCWIGMNSVILPGVQLGERTIVGAGSVVTKSFPEGFCVIAGNPAKKIKDIDKDKL